MHTSLITISVRHTEENILEGGTEQMLSSRHGVSGRPLSPLEVWQSWAVLARQLRAMLNPDGAAHAICDGVVEALSELGLHSHEHDLSQSTDGPLLPGDQFTAPHGGGSYRVVGVRPEGRELIVRWEPNT
jgi:hypothetical protein